MQPERRRMSAREIEAIAKKVGPRKGESLSKAEEAAFLRFRRPPIRDVVELAVEEASILESLTREFNVHDKAIRAHVDEMGPFRAKRLIKDLYARTDWD